MINTIIKNNLLQSDTNPRNIDNCHLLLGYNKEILLLYTFTTNDLRDKFLKYRLNNNFITSNFINARIETIVLLYLSIKTVNDAYKIKLYITRTIFE